MKTLDKALKPIAVEEWQKIAAIKPNFSVRELGLNIAKRYREELDLNNFAEELGYKEAEACVHARVKPVDHQTMMFEDEEWVKEELESINVRFGKRGDCVRGDKANYDQWHSRFMNQFEHAKDSMEQADKTKEILESEVGKMMKSDPSLGYLDALMLFRKKAGKNQTKPTS